jgi:hypothetical protein
MPRSARSSRSTILLGVGLDSEDGHRRVTRGRDFLLVGGSEDTHGEMQERAVRFDEELRRRGKRLVEVKSPDELREIADRAGM